ncbi:LytR C-terminal domain-containing protein [Aeromicrobium sp. 179-A 4D2 NHS]|uniref:LytR C-terminal domain-containing protein n=1 Tax=Aeromicrobium sp. 179-A 4D2 NHS TaxID=3142375 RepID=UPI0039A3255C
MSQPPVEPTGDRRDADRPSRPWLAIVLPAVWLLLGLAGGFVIISVVNGGDDAPPAAETTKGPTAAPTKAAPTKKPATKATPKPKRTPKPSPTPTSTPAPTRSVTVSVYNQVGIGGLARRVAGQLQALGWPIGTVDDWRGGVPQDTVYFPGGRQGEAELLARDLGISRILPAAPNMSTSALTVVLASPR